MVADTQMVLVPWPGSGFVHRGFYTALESIWPSMSQALTRLSADRTVWFVGHGLGAALATLAADRYAGTCRVCTFGSPRVGDSTFAAAMTTKFATRMLRFVNNHDIVTHLPPPLYGYTHIDLRRLIARDGTISNRPPTLQHFFSTLVGAPEQLLALIESLDAGASAFAPTFLLDHMPKAYAVWTWNDYLKVR
jgi:triacylglycerol lipase